MIDLTVIEGSIPPSTRAGLLEDLASIVMRWEGVPDTEFFREITWVYLHEKPAATLAVGGRHSGTPRFRVDVTVPEGTLSTRRRNGLIADVHGAVVAAAGLDPHSEQALHVWTLVHEIPDGHWGAAGRPIAFADLKKAAAASRGASTTARGGDSDE